MVLFEDVATVEVTVVVEVTVDRGLGGGKLLEGFHVPELRHRTAQIDPEKMQENQWPRNPVLTFWQSKRIFSDNAPKAVSVWVVGFFRSAGRDS
jgi:hypothetical protein